MGTVVAVETDDGVVVAGDTRVVENGTVTAETLERVFDIGDVVGGVAGDAGDVQAFQRGFEFEVSKQQLDAGSDLGVEKVAQIAAVEADSAGVEVVVAARDESGVARLRSVGADGRVLDNPVAAVGSGADVAYGLLETVGTGENLDDVAAAVRTVVENVAGQDPETGGEVVLCTLPNDAAATDDTDRRNEHSP